jgi:SNF2 family DNA or RNA helicase
VWHDVERNLIIYRQPDARLLKYVPDAKPVNGEYVAMPATLVNMQIARVFGLPVIRPLENYNYPRSAFIQEPFHAQKETANFLAVNPRAFVLNDMGTGKTLSALWAADALMRDVETRGEHLRALVVAPLSTLQTVWADTIFSNFCGRRTAVILHGTQEQRIAALAQPADFYLINHDGIKTGVRRVRSSRKSRDGLELRGFAAALQARDDIRLVVLDEVGAYRDHGTLRSAAARAVLSTRDIIWAMTGTPTPNGPLDAYGIAHLVNKAKGELFTHYRNRIMMQVPGSRFKWLPKAGANEEAMKLLSPAIRFGIDDCQDLPDLRYVNLDAPLSGEQTKRMREIKREFVLELKAGRVTAVNEAAVRTKLLQIACGAIYDDEHKAHRLDFRPRLALLRDLIGESLGKTIVFAPFISAVNALNEGLTDFTRAVIIGATSPRERTDIIRRFQQEDDPRVLIAHPETIAEGQTLTAAATTVWWGPCDKTNIYLQANKRMHRPGQDKPCTVVNVAGCRTEREIYKRLAENQSMQGLLLDMARNGLDDFA